MRLIGQQVLHFVCSRQAAGLHLALQRSGRRCLDEGHLLGVAVVLGLLVVNVTLRALAHLLRVLARECAHERRLPHLYRFRITHAALERPSVQRRTQRHRLVRVHAAERHGARRHGGHHALHRGHACSAANENHVVNRAALRKRCARRPLPRWDLRRSCWAVGGAPRALAAALGARRRRRFSGLVISRILACCVQVDAGGPGGLLDGPSQARQKRLAQRLHLRAAERDCAAFARCDTRRDCVALGQRLAQCPPR